MASYCAVCANQLIEQGAIVARIHDDGDGGVILRGGAHHGRAADVDIIHRIFVAAVGARHRGGKWIQIDGQQIDGLDVVRAHHLFIEAAPSQQAAVNLRVQSLDAAAHDFREAGVFGHFLDRDAVAYQEVGRAAGRQQLDAPFAQLACELDDAGLVGDAE
jgi:hypothetical protein